MRSHLQQESQQGVNLNDPPVSSTQSETTHYTGRRTTVNTTSPTAGTLQKGPGPAKEHIIFSPRILV